jgi:transposase
LNSRIAERLHLAINQDVAEQNQPKTTAPMNITVCGIDIASTSCQAALIDSRGKLLYNRSFQRTEEQLSSLCDQLPPNTRVVMESTSHYHLPWARRLASEGHEVFVLNPLLASRLGSASNSLRKHKTDPIDARELAELGQRHDEKLSHYRFKESPSRKGLMNLCKARRMQRDMVKILLQSANAMIETMMPELGPIDLHHNKSLAELFLHIDCLQTFKRLHRNTICKYACSATDQFLQALRGTQSAQHLFDPMLPALQAQLQAAQSLRTNILKLEADIRSMCRTSVQRKEDLDLIKSVPGFGPNNAPCLLAALPQDWQTWGSNNRERSRKMQAYFGYEPKLRQSGKWEGSMHMSKRGVELARTALFQSAMIGMLKDNHLSALYQKKRNEGKHHLVAVSALMRVQLQRIVAILVSRVPFDQSLDKYPQAA